MSFCSGDQEGWFGADRCTDECSIDGIRREDGDHIHSAEAYYR